MGCVAGQSTSISVYMLVLLYFFLFSFKFAPYQKIKSRARMMAPLIAPPLSGQVVIGPPEMSPSASILHFLKDHGGHRLHIYLHPKGGGKLKLKTERRHPILFSVICGQMRDLDASRPRREKRGPTRGRVKRYLQEKTLELTADFMVNWIRFETSVD
jgi:hypothetical protein